MSINPKQLIQNRRLVAIVILISLNAILFSTVNPLTSPILLVAAGFLVAVINLIVITYIGLLSLELVLRRRLPKKRLLIALGSFEALMLALASIGQLSWWDWVVIVAVWLIAYWYGAKIYHTNQS